MVSFTAQSRFRAAPPRAPDRSRKLQSRTVRRPLGEENIMNTMTGALLELSSGRPCRHPPIDLCPDEFDGWLDANPPETHPPTILAEAGCASAIEPGLPSGRRFRGNARPPPGAIFACSRDSSWPSKAGAASRHAHPSRCAPTRCLRGRSARPAFCGYSRSCKCGHRWTVAALVREAPTRRARDPKRRVKAPKSLVLRPLLRCAKASE